MTMRRERGVTLFISLIVLVALAMTTVALLRSIDSGVLIAGNLGFKRAATAAAEMGVESARQWLLDPAQNGNLDLERSSAVKGYYAEFDVFADFTTQTWTDSNSRKISGTRDGETIRVVIHRLCEDEGAVNSATCVLGDAATGGSTQTAVDYTKYIGSTSGKVYYRATARIESVKNTVSYVQTVFY